jgi:hypothetical protein
MELNEKDKTSLIQDVSRPRQSSNKSKSNTETPLPRKRGTKSLLSSSGNLTPISPDQLEEKNLKQSCSLVGKRRAAPAVEIKNTFPQQSCEDQHHAMNCNNRSGAGGLAAANHKNTKINDPNSNKTATMTLAQMSAGAT